MFQDYDQRIAIFHYGGHASGQGLRLEEGDAQAGGLAQFFQQQKDNLKLVFLNGCSTLPQVKRLMDLGIHAVIATAAPIEDAKAVEFAREFYRGLSARQPIGRAFENASAFLHTKYKGQEAPAVIEYRDVTFEDMGAPDVFPWGLYINKGHQEVLEWRLPLKARRLDAALQRSDYRPNQYLVYVLEAMLFLDDGLRDQLTNEEGLLVDTNGAPLNDQQKFYVILKHLPWPIGAQFQKLIAQREARPSRLRQIISTYLVTSQTLLYLIIAQLLSKPEKGPKKSLAVLQQAIDISREQFKTFDYLSFVKTLPLDDFFTSDQRPFVEEVIPFIQDLKDSDIGPGLTALPARHDQEITDVDFIGQYTGSGYYFLTASRDSTAVLWQMKQSLDVKSIYEYRHGEPLSAVNMSFIDKGTLVLTSGDRQIKIWDYDNDEQAIDSFPVPGTTAFELVTHEGSQFLFVASADKKLRFINIGTRDTFSFSIPEQATISSMDFSHNQLVAGLDNGHLIIWKLNKSFFRAPHAGFLEKNFDYEKAHSEIIKDVVLLDDGTKILTCSGDKSAKLWDTNIQLLKTFLGHNDGVQTITASQDGTVVYTGGEDKTIKKWELELAVYSPEYLFPEFPVVKATAVNNSPGQSKLLLCNDDKELVLYELDSRGEIEGDQVIPAPSAVTNMAISRDADQILATLADSAVLLNSSGDKLQSFPQVGDKALSAIAFSPDNNFILTSGGNITLVWKKDTRSRQFVCIDTLKNQHPVRLATVTTNADNDPVILTATAGGNAAYLWHQEQDSMSFETIAHTDEILGVAFSDDGHYFLTGSRDNSFTFGEVDKASEAHRVQRHNADVQAVAFYGRSNFLTADGDGIVRLWSIEDDQCEEQKSMIRHGGPIDKAAFLSKTHLLTLGTNGQARIWDMEDMDLFIQDKIHRFEEEEAKRILDGSSIWIVPIRN